MSEMLVRNITFGCGAFCAWWLACVVAREGQYGSAVMFGVIGMALLGAAVLLMVQP